MKKFISLVLALVMALSLTTAAWGADVNVGTGQSLADAITAAGADGTVTLMGDVEVTALVNITKDVTINLNGHKLSRDNGGSVVMVKNNATLTILGTTTGSTFYGRINLGEANNNNGNLVIDGGTYSCAAGQTVLHVNGTCLDSDASIYDAAITSPTDNAIQFNGAGTFVIDNCVITGATGIYMKAGTLSVTNTTVTANGAKVAPTPNGDGSNTTGDALVMDTMTGYAGDMKVTLGAGNTFTSTNGYAIQESNTANAASSAVISLVITNGSYTGAAGAIEATDEFDDAVEAGTITASISGGTFSSDVSDYAAPGFVLTQNAGGGYTANPDTAGSTFAPLYDLKKANAAGTEVKGDIGYEVIAASKDDSRGYTTGTLEYVKMDGKLFVKIAAADATISDFYVTKANEKTAQFYLKQIDSVADVSYDFVAEKFTNFGYKCDQMNASYVDYVTNEVGYYVWTHPVTGDKVYFADDAVTTGDAYYNKAVLRTGASNLLVGDKIVEAYGFVVAGTDNPADPLNQHVWAPVAYDKTTPVKAQCGVCGAQAAVYKNNKAPAGSDVIDVTFNQVPYDLVITYTGGYTGTVVTPSTDKVESAETFDAGIAMYVGMSVMAAAGSAVVLKKKD